MQQSHQTKPIQLFFYLIDRITAAQGLNREQIVDINKLRLLPKGTFGRAWADFLDQNNLQPLTSGSRRKQLHDGVHVLTGYGSDTIGEAEVQAFLLGAKFTIFNLAIALGLLPIIYKRLPVQTRFIKDRIWQAYQRGLKCQFDPDSWEPELLWSKTLTDVQALFFGL